MTSKYRAKKIKIHDIVFDSKKEANRYLQLKILEDKGKIHGLELQKKFELLPRQTVTIKRYSEKTGRRLKDKEKVLEKACCYLADFVYYDDKGNLVVEDTKGFRTPDYIIKRKLMLWVHGIQIKEL